MKELGCMIIFYFIFFIFNIILHLFPANNLIEYVISEKRKSYLAVFIVTFLISVIAFIIFTVITTKDDVSKFVYYPLVYYYEFLFVLSFSLLTYSVFFTKQKKIRIKHTLIIMFISFSLPLTLPIQENILISGAQYVAENDTDCENQKKAESNEVNEEKNIYDQRKNDKHEASLNIKRLRNS